MDAKIQKVKSKLGIKAIWMAILLFAGVLLVASIMPNGKADGVITRVVIDAGHGGKDPGNLGTGRYKLTEKSIALNVSLKLGEYIKEAFPDVEVMYTREDDEFIALHERTSFANTKNADIFISIHCDAFTRESAVGCGSYVMGAAKTEANLRMAQKENKAILLEEDRNENYDGFDPSSPEGLIELSLRQNAHIMQSLKFAQQVQDQMRERVGRVDRGVKQAPFWVISFTTMPSVLIELGFLTNKEEEDFLISDKGQDYTASAIYRAFKAYKLELEKVEATMQLNDKSQVKPKTDAAKSEISKPASVVFKVQLLSSSSKIALRPENFEGLENVEEYQDNGLYKYLYGSTDSYEGAKNLQKSVRKNGYKGAFVVAFDDKNNRIALDAALKSISPN